MSIVFSYKVLYSREELLKMSFQEVINMIDRFEDTCETTIRDFILFIGNENFRNKWPYLVVQTCSYLEHPNGTSTYCDDNPLSGVREEEDVLFFYEEKSMIGTKVYLAIKEYENKKKLEILEESLND